MPINSLAALESSPEKLRDGIWVFPPNKDCMGGTSWWLDCEPEPLLIDCPPINDQTVAMLGKLCSNRNARILLTNREGHGKIRSLQDSLGWPVLIQEQEAYLLPGLSNLKSFEEEHTTVSGVRLLWTPGPTPGSCVAYVGEPWNVLFCGRLLIPLAKDRMASIRNKRTFHWSWQQKSLERLRQWLPPDARPQLASGGSLGAMKERKLADWDYWQDSYSITNEMMH